MLTASRHCAVRFGAPLLTVAVAALLAACIGPVSDRATPASSPSNGSSNEPSAATSPGSPAPAGSDVVEVSCAELIDVVEATDPRDVVLDVVSLPIRTVLEPADGEPGWLFAKHGLIVRAGAEVELRVPESVAERARIGWGNSGAIGTRVRVPACESGAGWLVWAGGFWVRSPMCLPLEISAGGRQASAAIAVGAAC